MLEQFTVWVLENLDYWVVTLAMAVESSFIPFPSEVVVPPAAWLATVDDSMNIVLVVIFATLGANIGALVNYYLALWLGRPFVYKFANSKFGHLCLINEEKMKKAEQYFNDHGAVSTFIGRLIPGIRQLISIPAGLAKMKLLPFLAYTTLGAGIWNIVLAAIGWSISKIPGVDSKEAVVALAKDYSHIIGYCILALLAIAVLFAAWKMLRKKKG